MVATLRTWSFRLLVAGMSALLVLSASGWSSPARAATLTDDVTVVLAVPAGGTQDSTTLQELADTVNGPVADYWNGQSSGAIRIGVTGQVNWYQSAFDCSNPSALLNEAAQRSGWSSANGQHLLVYTPAVGSTCGKVYAENGGYLHAPGRMRITAPTASVIARGLGSNMGFEKSDEYQCDGAVDSGTCTTASLGDYYDVMGGIQDQLGSLNVVHAAKLGLLPAQQLVALSMSDAPATVTLAPVSGSTGVRAISLTVPGGWVYWLEYRPATGQDAWLGTAANTRGLEPGVLLRAVTNGNPSLLLDGTPSAAANWGTDTHQALPVGSAVQFGNGIFSVTVTSVGANAVVHVVPTSPITRAHDNYGGDAGALGAATGPEQCAGPDYSPYCYRTYQNGNIYWSLPLGAHAVKGDMLRDWLATGGPSGSFGLPLYDDVCGLAAGGCRQEFQGGTLYSTPGAGWSVAGNKLPYGNFEGASSSGVDYTVTGWAIDPDTPVSAVSVRADLDGQPGLSVVADQYRGDVGAAFPAAGAQHGFTLSGSMTPGTHNVCLYAIDRQLPSAQTALGCRTVTWASILPRGNWEGVSANGTTLLLSGWAFDPDWPNQNVAVDVYVDGAFGTTLSADQSRPDVGAAFPFAGAFHGFSWSSTLTPGVHTVCLYAIDPQEPWTHTDLGCRQVPVEMTLPRANWEGLSADGTTLSVSGWAFDPDSPASASAVHVYVDGAGTALTANGSRPDVGAAFPTAGAAHGFSWSTTVAPGNHTVCVYAIDAQLPSTHTTLGCRTVAVAMTLPRGNWEAASLTGTTLSVSGWAFDPDSPASASAVHVYVDGAGTALTANGSRPDVGAAFPSAGAAHGFSWSTTVAPAQHTVCLYAIDAQQPSTHTDLGCRVVG